MFPEVLVALTPPIVTEVTARLSVTTAVKVALAVLAEVFTVIAVLSLLNELITGSSSSVLVIVTVSCWLCVFPAASVAVAVNTWVLEPQL